MIVPPPFCIIGTPRSRTAWFARFLTHGVVVCEHEPSADWQSTSDMLQYFRPGRAASDSMLTLKWADLLGAGVKLVAVVRPKGEVLQSALAAGLASAGTVSALDRIYAAIAALPPLVQQYCYTDLNIRKCAEIFSSCHGVAPPAAWLYHWHGFTVEADYASVMAKARKNAVGLARFYGLTDEKGSS